NPHTASIPYGKPLRNQQIHIYNQRWQPVPDHTIGQIYISGASLATGYHRDPERTRHSFISHPNTQEPVYATRDLDRYLPHRTIELLGRTDHQIKPHGYRIEPGEIEHTLTQHPHIHQALITTTGNHLTAYLTTNHPEIDPDELAADLRRHLGERLPSY